LISIEPIKKENERNIKNVSNKKNIKKSSQIHCETYILSISGLEIYKRKLIETLATVSN
jgi:hypothetical protein